MLSLLLPGRTMWAPPHCVPDLVPTNRELPPQANLWWLKDSGHTWQKTAVLLTQQEGGHV